MSIAPIMIFDQSKRNSKILIHDIESLYEMKSSAIDFQYYSPDEVFRSSVSSRAWIAFFTLSNMYDVEAARKFNAFYKDVPLIVVSDSKEYGIVSLDLGTCYYLIRPICKNSLRRALQKAFEISIENKRKKLG